MPQGRTSFEQIALLLQGGGALGAYQAGVYEALSEADLHPDWVAGISIGAVNAAIIAGSDEYFWDGGLISNTPLEWVLDARPRRDTLAFQVDLWNKRGELPKDMMAVEVRQKEIIYSSRNRAATDRYQHMQKLRIALANLLERMPEKLRGSADAKLLLAEADDKVCNIVHLIYRARPYEGIVKDFEFSRRIMEEHWQTGYNNARQSLANPEVLELPDRLEGVRAFDIGAERA